MDYMRSKSKFSKKAILKVLNVALVEFAKWGGILPKSENENKHKCFKHCDLGCIQQSADFSTGYMLYWHLDHLVRNQESIVIPEELERIGYKIEHDPFDSRVQFKRIQATFPKIINQEVFAETGLFYNSDNTLEAHGSGTGAGLCLSSQSQVCFFDFTLQFPFLFYN